jgi:hypothetical protein
MPEYEDYDEAEEVTESKNPLRARMKELEAEVKAFRQEKAELEQSKRELAFLKAGVDPTDGAAKYFIKGYDGELTVEAIQAAAREARLLSPVEDSTEQAEKQAWRRTNDVAADAGSPAVMPDLDERLLKARDPQEIMRILAEAQNQ